MIDVPLTHGLDQPDAAVRVLGLDVELMDGEQEHILDRHAPSREMQPMEVGAVDVQMWHLRSGRLIGLDVRVERGWNGAPGVVDAARSARNPA